MFSKLSKLKFTPDMATSIPRAMTLFGIIQRMYTIYFLDQ